MKHALVPLAALAVLAGPVTGGPPSPSPSEALHNKLQAQFDDLTLLYSKGAVGMNRIDFNQLNRHAGWRISPGRDTVAQLEIFGAHGKALDKNEIDRRAHRSFRVVSHPDLSLVSTTAASLALAKKAAKAFGKGKSSLLIGKVGPAVLEARPIRLSKKECLKCHEGMKIGSPVALSVVLVLPPSLAKKARPIGGPNGRENPRGASPG